MRRENVDATKLIAPHGMRHAIACIQGRRGFNWRAVASLGSTQGQLAWYRPSVYQVRRSQRQTGLPPTKTASFSF